ncbi:hypothetical protein BSL78_29143 [Apostichopus japonicus]|uniref:Pre-rRNA-processing protein TSR1 homolog n=1 Tax=Stichopus japonicus TaxID=307972 RepID=A0A2G8JE70_STIJA|nr:hypothetical protein BSL78_29143 [Apostichopus japonicus]
MVLGQETHRAGPLKQKNKSHKTGRHRSKGQIDNVMKGRANVKVLSKHMRKQQKKADRRNQAIQRRKKHREELLTHKRSIGGKDTAPHLVLVVSLHTELDAQKVLQKLIGCEDENQLHEGSKDGIFNVSVTKFKQRFTFVLPPANLSAILDTAKVADSVLGLMPPTEAWDDWGELCLSCLFAQGLPTTTITTQGLADVPAKKRNEIRKALNKAVERRFPDSKFFSCDSDQEARACYDISAIRRLNPSSGGNPDLTCWWRGPSLSLMKTESVGTLKVTGFLRGPPLSVNGLVHLTGLGDFQMQQIDASPDLCPLLQQTKTKTAKKEAARMEEGDAVSLQMEEDITVLEKVDASRQESLETEAVVDPMEGEQTWPTQEELEAADASNEEKESVVKKVPKGTSDYQAMWIIESDQEEGSGDEDDDDDDDDDDDEMAAQDVDTDDDDTASVAKTDNMETMSITSEIKANYDVHFDEETELEMLKKYREERENEAFPDEVDTPMDDRGLKSFRTSPWDCKENLPMDYSRIFQFQDFNRAKKKALSKAPEGFAEHGNCITVHIANVPKSLIDNHPNGHPLIMSGLLAHEQKMSVMHFAIKRHFTSEEPIKSKERLIFQVGYRRFSACPIFSEHTVGNRQKYERFLPKDTSVVVATVYAPICFPPSSVLVFKENSSGLHALVATGTTLGSNPDRIVVKRAVLSGHPFKIINRTAVVRYMFFNREDILWFKPVELRTKWGRRGHIKEPLGTHGHMKCIFDGNLKSQDTILMNLYKRMYPKWTFDPTGVSSLQITPENLPTAANKDLEMDE